MEIYRIILLTLLWPVIALAVPDLDEALLKKLVIEKDLVQLASDLGGKPSADGKLIELKGLSHDGIEIVCAFSTQSDPDARFSMSNLKLTPQAKVDGLIKFIKELVDGQLGRSVYRSKMTFAEDTPKGVVIPAYVWQAQDDFVLLSNHIYSEDGFFTFAKVPKDKVLSDPNEEVAQWWKGVSDELTLMANNSVNDQAKDISNTQNQAATAILASNDTEAKQIEGRERSSKSGWSILVGALLFGGLVYLWTRKNSNQ